MQIQLLCALICGELNKFVDLVFVAVHTACREQTKHMQRTAVIFGLADGVEQHGVVMEAVVFNGQLDACQVLVDHSTGTQVHVSNFRITHLSIGQTHVEARARDQGGGAVLPHRIPIGGCCCRDGVVFGFGTIAPAIQHNKCGAGAFC